MDAGAPTSDRSRRGSDLDTIRDGECTAPGKQCAGGVIPAVAGEDQIKLVLVVVVDMVIDDSVASVAVCVRVNECLAWSVVYSENELPSESGVTTNTPKSPLTMSVGDTAQLPHMRSYESHLISFPHEFRMTIVTP